MSDPNLAVIDMDLYKYHAAAAGEKRSVLITNKVTGKGREFKTRKSFYGDWRKKEGGILAEMNAGREEQLTWEDYEYEDIQRPEPIENVLHTAKIMVEKDLKLSGAKSYKAFLGEGESFRVGLSTLLQYKDREDLIKPVLLEEVTEYLRKKFSAETVKGAECDDAVVISCYKQPKHYALIEDKDFWGCPINVWDRNQQERGIVNCNKFGHLFIDSKGKVRGEGRVHLYFQMCSEDDTDNYKANCFSETKWGAKSAYKALIECKTDKEAWVRMKEVFMKLYPEEKVVMGWRNEPINITWDYVLNEMFVMARMLRFYDENTNAYDVMDKMGVVWKI